jgi:F-type H+-transporting ATPase subunit delta
MQGSSRRSLASLEERLLSSGDDAAGISGDLLGVAALLRREGGLRAAATDPGAAPASRAALARSLFEGRIGAGAVDLVASALQAPWSTPRDLADALEILGAAAAFLGAERAGTLDAVEDELFRFGRTVQGQQELRAVLDDAQVDANRKVAILRSLLSERVQPVTLELLEHLLRNDRTRRFSTGIEQLSALAAQRRDEMLAEVVVAAPLEPEQERRLAEALGRVYRRPRIRLQMIVDPTVLGGAVVRVGNDVLNGSVAARLDQARRQLAG